MVLTGVDVDAVRAVLARYDQARAQRPERMRRHGHDCLLSDWLCKLGGVDDSSVTEQEREPGVDGRRIIVLAAVAVAAVAAYFAFAMPGMDHGGGSAGMASMELSEMAVGVDEFASRLASSDAFVVNVHVPDEGTIEGTDASIPYNEIVGDERLPPDKTTPIVLYCKTGRMSAEAATALMDAGYSDVVQLDGGMDAWVAAGRTLQ